MVISEYLSDYLLRDSNASEDEREIVQFGIESIIGNMTGLLLTITIGFCFGEPMVSLLFYILFFPLRKSAGGFHADTKGRCFIISVVILILSFTLFVMFEHSQLFFVMSFIAFGVIILILTPVDNPSKRYDNKERKIYRRRSLIVLVVESLIFVVACYFKWDTAIKSLEMVFFVGSSSMVMGSFKNKVLH